MAFNDTLFQLGMDLTRSSPAQKEEHGEVAHVMAQHTKKNERESGRFAGTTPKTMGTHVTIDVYGITGLDTIEHVETTLSRVVSAACVSVASSTLQHLHLHPVPATGGISGVAVLSDGHISFHSRPGAGYAVLDISSGAGEMHRWVAAAKAAFGNCQIVTRVHKGFEMTAGSDNDRGQSAILAAVMPQRRQRAGLKSVRVKAA